MRPSMPSSATSACYHPQDRDPQRVSTSLHKCMCTTINLFNKMSKERFSCSCNVVLCTCIKLSMCRNGHDGCIVYKNCNHRNVCNVIVTARTFVSSDFLNGFMHAVRTLPPCPLPVCCERSGRITLSLHFQYHVDLV